jgi:phage replication O-like protein O
MRIIESNYTQVPNVLLDNIKEFSYPEFLILMFICRKTFGWQKEEDRISLTQLQNGTGLSRQGVLTAIDSLLYANMIFKKKSSKGNIYSLVVNMVDHGSQPRGLPVVNGIDTQKISIKDNYTKENNTVPAGQPTTEQQQEQKEPKPKSPHQQIIDLYYELFQDYCGRRPVWDDGLGKTVKELLLKQSMADIMAVMRAYFDPVNRNLWFMKGQQLNWKHFRANYDAIPTSATVEESFIDKARRELVGG